MRPMLLVLAAVVVAAACRDSVTGSTPPVSPGKVNLWNGPVTVARNIAYPDGGFENLAIEGYVTFERDDEALGHLIPGTIGYRVAAMTSLKASHTGSSLGGLCITGGGATLDLRPSDGYLYVHPDGHYEGRLEHVATFSSTLTCTVGGRLSVTPLSVPTGLVLKIEGVLASGPRMQGTMPSTPVGTATLTGSWTLDGFQ